MGLHLHEHDVAQLMKKYDHDHDGEISYGEFCSAMIASDYTDRSKGPSNKGSFHSGADGHEEMTHDEKLLYLQHMKDLKVSTDKKRRLNSLLHEFAMVFFIIVVIVYHVSLINLLGIQSTKLDENWLVHWKGTVDASTIDTNFCEPTNGSAQGRNSKIDQWFNE
jgi:hypothetical protein